MNQTIVKTESSMKTLNELVSRGFYQGEIADEKFELIRENFPNNYKIIGILDDSGKFNIRSSMKSGMKIAGNVLLIIGIILSIYSFFKANWILPLIFIIGVFIHLINVYQNRKKELDRFTDKFLEFHST